MSARVERAGAGAEYFMIRIQAEYFMIRVQANPDPPAIAGAIEHLGTGEKRSFESGEELLSLLSSWLERGSKLLPGAGESNR